MATNPIQIGAAGIDLSGRWFENHTVVASPAAAAETIICSLTLPRALFINKGVVLQAVAAFTVGTSGTIIYATGPLTMAATNLVNLSGQGLDSSPLAAPQTYVITLTITAGAAVSTVSAVSLVAAVI